MKEGVSLVESAIHRMHDAGATVIDNLSIGLDLFPLLSETRTNYYEAQFSYDIYFVVSVQMRL